MTRVFQRHFKIPFEPESPSNPATGKVANGNGAATVEEPDAKSGPKNDPRPPSRKAETPGTEVSLLFKVKQGLLRASGKSQSRSKTSPKGGRNLTANEVGSSGMDLSSQSNQKEAAPKDGGKSSEEDGKNAEKTPFTDEKSDTKDMKTSSKFVASSTVAPSKQPDNEGQVTVMPAQLSKAKSKGSGDVSEKNSKQPKPENDLTMWERVFGKDENQMKSEGSKPNNDKKDEKESDEGKAEKDLADDKNQEKEEPTFLQKLMGQSKDPSGSKKSSIKTKSESPGSKKGEDSAKNADPDKDKESASVEPTFVEKLFGRQSKEPGGSQKSLKSTEGEKKDEEVPDKPPEPKKENDDAEEKVKDSKSETKSDALKKSNKSNVARDKPELSFLERVFGTSEPDQRQHSYRSSKQESALGDNEKVALLKKLVELERDSKKKKEILDMFEKTQRDAETVDKKDASKDDTPDKKGDFRPKSAKDEKEALQRISLDLSELNAKIAQSKGFVESRVKKLEEAEKKPKPSENPPSIDTKQGLEVQEKAEQDLNQVEPAEEEQEEQLQEDGDGKPLRKPYQTKDRTIPEAGTSAPATKPLCPLCPWSFCCGEAEKSEPECGTMNSQEPLPSTPVQFQDPKVENTTSSGTKRVSTKNLSPRNKSIEEVPGQEAEEVKEVKTPPTKNSPSAAMKVSDSDLKKAISSLVQPGPDQTSPSEKLRTVPQQQPQPPPGPSISQPAPPPIDVKPKEQSQNYGKDRKEVSKGPNIERFDSKVGGMSNKKIPPVFGDIPPVPPPGTTESKRQGADIGLSGRTKAVVSPPKQVADVDMAPRSKATSSPAKQVADVDIAPRSAPAGGPPARQIADAPASQEAAPVSESRKQIVDASTFQQGTPALKSTVGQRSDPVPPEHYRQGEPSGGFPNDARTENETNTASLLEHYHKLSSGDVSTEGKDLDESSQRAVQCPDLKCGDMVPLSSLVLHIRERHPFALWLGELKDGYVSRQYWYLNSKTSFRKVSNTWVLTIMSYKGHHFAALFTKDERRFYSWVYILSHARDAAKFFCEISVSDSDGSHGGTYLFRGKVHPIDEKSDDIRRWGDCLILERETVMQCMTNVGLPNDRRQQGYDFRLPTEYILSSV